jgi:hypothetical protein
VNLITAPELTGLTRTSKLGQECNFVLFPFFFINLCHSDGWRRVKMNRRVSAFSVSGMYEASAVDLDLVGSLLIEAEPHDIQCGRAFQALCSCAFTDGPLLPKSPLVI